MSDVAAPRAGLSGLRDWLTTDTPRSRLQARCGRAYLGWRGLLRNPLAMVGLGIVFALLVAAALAPMLTDYSPYAQELRQRLRPPDAAHWLGTDELGRDIFSRVLHGARLTLYIVALVAVIAAPVGLLIGTVAAMSAGGSIRC